MMMLTRREFLGGFLAAAILGGGAFAQAPRRPNILVIFADDLGYADLGSTGAADVPTPHIDSIAAGGLRCTNAYVSAPQCSPSRAGLLTGRYQQRYGFEYNPLANQPEAGLDPAAETIAGQLRARGYATGLVGKWHLGYTERFHPMKRGFSEMFGFIGGGHMYVESQAAPGAPAWQSEYNMPLLRDGAPAPFKGYLTDLLGEEAAAFIRRHNADPWFLYLAFNAPHTPIQPSPRALERVAAIEDERRRNYAAMIVAMDDTVGNVLKTLRETGQDRDTLVIFLSDNGGPTWVSPTSNAPFRGMKGNVLEGGIRVPFFVRWPGRIPAGGRFDDPVISLDIMPTALALAGKPAGPDLALDGVNLLPHWEGREPKPPHEALYWRWCQTSATNAAVRRGPWKLVADYDLASGKLGGLQLYNLAEDCGEANNLAEAQPEITAELAALWKRWNAELKQPAFPLGTAPGKKKKAPAKK